MGTAIRFVDQFTQAAAPTWLGKQSAQSAKTIYAAKNL
jgi:hypothetical protein